jgi:hypothetical protein
VSAQLRRLILGLGSRAAALGRHRDAGGDKEEGSRTTRFHE